MKHNWLYYNEERNLAFCFTCVRAYKERKLSFLFSMDLSFISRGFSNWKDATVKLKAHESFKCHNASIFQILFQ
uniref:TTF-type domain-containing protein n=1 Tax=Amphimedon queenslandica TaxID=400682 RepID=A0A1X7VSG4_AMPQE